MLHKSNETEKQKGGSQRLKKCVRVFVGCGNQVVPTEIQFNATFIKICKFEIDSSAAAEQYAWKCGEDLFFSSNLKQKARIY